MAALLGHHLGLPVPPIAIVEIDPRFAIAIPDPQMRDLVAGDRGPHFGSLHRTGGYGVALFPVPIRLMPQVLDIFTFDMLIQNPDRRRVKPNLLFDGEQYVLFDHELAFSFLADIGPSSLPWELRKLSLVKDHVIYGQLIHYAESHDLSFERFLSRLTTVSDSLLNEMVSAIPERWHGSAKTGKIVLHIAAIRDNIPRFERGLREALA